MHKKTPEKKGLKKSDPDSAKKRKKEVIPQLLLPWAAFLRPTAHIYWQALLVRNAGDRDVCLIFFNAFFEIPLDFPIHSLTHFPHSHSSPFTSRT
jgi:hypothetical protein